METTSAIKTDTAVDVGTLISLLRDPKTTQKARFRIALPTVNIKKVLTEAYKVEVQARYRAFIPDADMESAVSIISDSLSGATKDSRFGIMLYGYTGNGKTTMLRAISRVIRTCQRAQLCSRDFGTLAIYDACDILRISGDVASWREFKDIPLLAIDDFGKEATDVSTYGNISSPMIELLEYRYRRMLYTVISSNMKPEEVKTKYGQRIADRFNEMMDVAVFRGKTHRM